MSSLEQKAVYDRDLAHLFPIIFYLMTAKVSKLAIFEPVHHPFLGHNNPRTWHPPKSFVIFNHAYHRSEKIPRIFCISKDIYHKVENLDMFFEKTIIFFILQRRITKKFFSIMQNLRVFMSKNQRPNKEVSS